MNNLSILIVDDDSAIVEFLRTSLEKERWNTFSAADGEEALKLVEKETFDLVILDIAMPKMDGIEVCRRLRSQHLVPIIMLSARGDMSDKVICLNNGADDYLTKPFDIEELVARIKAVMRRNHHAVTVPVSSYKNDRIDIDFNARQVLIQGEKVRLTPTEFNLLQELVLNAGKVLDYRYLLTKVWGHQYGTEREYLHVYIGRLRSKVEIDPKVPQYILSVAGVGYLFKNE